MFTTDEARELLTKAHKSSRHTQHTLAELSAPDAPPTPLSSIPADDHKPNTPPIHATNRHPRQHSSPLAVNKPHRRSPKNRVTKPTNTAYSNGTVGASEIGVLGFKLRRPTRSTLSISSPLRITLRFRNLIEPAVSQPLPNRSKQSIT